MSTIIGIAGGPEAGGRTATAVAGILAGAAASGSTKGHALLLALSSGARPAGRRLGRWTGR